MVHSVISRVQLGSPLVDTQVARRKAASYSDQPPGERRRRAVQ